MIVLAENPSRASVYGFLVALGLLLSVGLGLGNLLWSGAMAPGVFLGLVVLGVLVLVEVFLPDSLRSIYDVWNAVANWVARFLHRWTVAMVYLVVRTVALVQRQGAHAEPRQRHSMWNERGTVVREAYGGQSNRPYRSGSGDMHWTVDYLRWSISSGNGWVVFLVPFLLVLRATATEERDDVPENLYTLY